MEEERKGKKKSGKEKKKQSMKLSGDVEYGKYGHMCVYANMWGTYWKYWTDKFCSLCEKFPTPEYWELQIGPNQR